MSVILKEIEMPKNCSDCPCFDGENGECRATGSRDTWCSEPPRSCPLKSIDGLIDEFKKRYPKNYAGDFELGGRSCKFSLTQVIRIIKEYCEVE